MKKLPFKCKPVKVKYGNRELWQIKIYWPFQKMVNNLVRIHNKHIQGECYQMQPLLFANEQDAKEFIQNKLYEHWQWLEKNSQKVLHGYTITR